MKHFSVSFLAFFFLASPLEKMIAQPPCPVANTSQIGGVGWGSSNPWPNFGGNMPPLDLLHLHEMGTIGCTGNSFTSPAVRLSLGTVANANAWGSQAFAQLSIVSANQINSNISHTNDVILKASTNAHDLILTDWSANGAIRLATTDAERMTILSNGNIGINNNMPGFHLAIGPDFGINSNGTSTSLGWKEINYNCLWNGTNMLRTKVGPAQRMFFAADGNIYLETYVSGSVGSSLSSIAAMDFHIGVDDLVVGGGVGEGCLFRITNSHYATAGEASSVFIQNKVQIGFSTGGNEFLTNIHPPFQPSGSYMLSVNGSILASELVIDARQATWSDFVFDPSYKLPSLKEVEKFVNAEHHLSGIPTTTEVEKNGIAIGYLQSKLLQKIEELTLYVIRLQKENEQLTQRIDKLEKN